MVIAMKHGRFIERLFLLLISIGAVYFVAYTVYSDLRATKQRTLYYQLQILRMGVNIYQLVNHRNPLSIEDLFTRTYQLPGNPSQRHFVEGIAAEANGRILDPFNNSFFYDPMTGWIRSTTSGYEFW